MDLNNDLVTELNESCASGGLACDRVQKTETHVKELNEHVEASNAKYLEIFVNAARVEKELRRRVTSLESVLKAEEDCKAPFEEACVDENAKSQDVNAARQKTHGARKGQLREEGETLSQIRVELAVATSKLE